MNGIVKKGFVERRQVYAQIAYVRQSGFTYSACDRLINIVERFETSNRQVI